MITNVVTPSDSHVHSEWSWDAFCGSMEQTCKRATELGLPAIAFTEHVDHTVWKVALDALDDDETLRSMTSPDGLLTPPAFDAVGYLEAIETCRERFPSLKILSGLEIGEPHWHAAAVEGVLAAGPFDRVLGSLHCLPDGDVFAEPPGLFSHRGSAEVMRAYLGEVTRLVSADDMFEVLAHIDYPVRSWPSHTGLFDVRAFEDEFRLALRATAESGRALEINTKVPLHEAVVEWWRDEGGDAITFGSDAHDPAGLARGFRDAAHMAEAYGFRPGRSPHDLWGRLP